MNSPPCSVKIERLEWPKVVSEVSFPTCWGVFKSIKVVSVFRSEDIDFTFPSPLYLYRLSSQLENLTVLYIPTLYMDTDLLAVVDLSI